MRRGGESRPSYPTLRDTPTQYPQIWVVASLHGRKVRPVQQRKQETCCFYALQSVAREEPRGTRARTNSATMQQLLQQLEISLQRYPWRNIPATVSATPMA